MHGVEVPERIEAIEVYKRVQHAMPDLRVSDDAPDLDRARFAREAHDEAERIRDAEERRQRVEKAQAERAAAAKAERDALVEAATREGKLTEFLLAERREQFERERWQREMTFARTHASTIGYGASTIRHRGGGPTMVAFRSGGVIPHAADIAAGLAAGDAVVLPSDTFIDFL